MNATARTSLLTYTVRFPYQPYRMEMEYRPADDDADFSKGQDMLCEFRRQWYFKVMQTHLIGSQQHPPVPEMPADWGSVCQDSMNDDVYELNLEMWYSHEKVMDFSLPLMRPGGQQMHGLYDRAVAEGMCRQAARYERGDTVKRIAIMASGGGSNALALAEAIRELDGAELVSVVSDKRDAGAMLREDIGKEVSRVHVPETVRDEVESRLRILLCDDFDTLFEDRLLDYLVEADIDIVCLAGFMKILSPKFLYRFNKRTGGSVMLNIHPGIDPRLDGQLGTHRKAIEMGLREHGSKVHYVTAEVDKGKVILSGKTGILPGETAGQLETRVKDIEHRIYPLALKWIVEGNLDGEFGKSYDF